MASDPAETGSPLDHARSILSSFVKNVFQGTVNLICSCGDKDSWASLPSTAAPAESDFPGEQTSSSFPAARRSILPAEPTRLPLHTRLSLQGAGTKDDLPAGRTSVPSARGFILPAKPTSLPSWHDKVQLQGRYKPEDDLPAGRTSVPSPAERSGTDLSAEWLPSSATAATIEKDAPADRTSISSAASHPTIEKDAPADRTSISSAARHQDPDGAVDIQAQHMNGFSPASRTDNDQHSERKSTSPAEGVATEVIPTSSDDPPADCACDKPRTSISSNASKRGVAVMSEIYLGNFNKLPESGEFCLNVPPLVSSGKYTFTRKTRKLESTGMCDGHPDVPGVVGTLACEQVSIFEDESTFRMPAFVYFKNSGGLPGLKEFTKYITGDIVKTIQDPSSAGATFLLPTRLEGADKQSTGPDDVARHIAKGQLAVHPAVGQFLLDGAAMEGRPRGISAFAQIFDQAQSPCAKHFAKAPGGGWLAPVPESRAEAAKMFEDVRKSLILLLIPSMLDVPANGFVQESSDGDGKYEASSARHLVDLLYVSLPPIMAPPNQLDEEQDEIAKDFHSQVVQAMIAAQYYGALEQLALSEKAASAEAPLVVYVPPVGLEIDNPVKTTFECVYVAVILLEQNQSEEIRQRLDIRLLVEGSEVDLSLGESLLYDPPEL